MRMKLLRLVLKLLGKQVIGEDCGPGFLTIYIST